MKKTFLSVLIITLIIAACVRKQNNFPQGAWQLVQVQSIVDGKKEVTFPATSFNASQIKMWTEKNWCIIGEWSQDTLKGDNYGGGTYIIKGNQYEETIKYHTSKVYVGKTLKMTLELKSDTLIQNYQLVDSTGRQIENESAIEKYIRIK
jgi:hypothetical protein